MHLLAHTRRESRVIQNQRWPTINHRNTILRSTIAVLGAAVVFLWGIGVTQGAVLPAVPVQSAAVVIAAVPPAERVLGRVDSLGKTTVSASMTGKIVGPFQNTGQVAAGAVIARNVPPMLESSVAGARTDLAIAKAAYARTRQLVTDRLRTQLALARAERDVVRAKERLSGLRQQAAQQVIRAPFAGTLQYLVSPGTVAYRGTPIAVISGRARPWIDVRVPPEVARLVPVNEHVRIRAIGWSGTGRVISVGHDARPLGLVQVRITLPHGSPLVPGQWAWVRLGRHGPPAPVVPAAAVVMRHGRSMVFVLHHGHAYAVSVRVLTEQHGKAWLAGSLHVGEQIAVRHAARLTEGSPISIESGPPSDALR